MLAARIPVAAASGLLASLVMFFALSQLVAVPFVTGPTLPIFEIEFTPKIFTTPTESKRNEKPQREPPRLAPKGPRGPTVHADPRSSGFTPTSVPIVGPQRQGLPVGVDRDVVPLVRINPDYPPREATRGVEGWVRVQFSVSATGMVRDAVVVAAEPRGAFEKAALDAIARWRYNPRVEGGIAVERVGLETVIRFELEN